MKDIMEQNVEILDEDAAFDAELEALMQDDSNGKGKKKKKAKKEKGERKFFTSWKHWSKGRKITTVLVAVAAGAFIFSSTRGEKVVPQQMVMTTPIVRGDIVENLSVSGPVSGTDSVDVVSNLHAEVLDIQVKEGDQVTKDQILAVIDSEDIQKEVEIAQNSYDLAVSTYHEQQILAENGYASAQQAYQAAKTEYNRTYVLYQAGDVSQLEMETVGNRLNDAERELRTFTLQDGKPIANESYALQIKSAEFELEKKKTALDNTQVKSPIEGTVVRVNAKVGRFADTIEDDKPMFIIENLDVLEMKINVSEYSIGKISVGQEATIRADILNGDTMTGVVTAISPTGEEKGGGSSERVIPTTIRIEEQSTKLIAGITAKADIVLNESLDTLIVPISALVSMEDGTYIAVEEDGIIKLIQVEVGVESDIQIEVFAAEGSFIEEGASVVTNPTPYMTDGMAVMAIPVV